MELTSFSELSSLLDSLESEADSLSTENDQTSTDNERANGYIIQVSTIYFSRYQLAENINAQLDQMASTLKGLVDKLNSTQEKNVDSENPVWRSTSFS